MTLEEYNKQTTKQYKPQRDADIKAAQDVAQTNKELINKSYATEIADTKEEYEPLFRQNEVQRVLNERYLERKAAEMGLTDSGMNRTQMTANQLSYANQNAEYSRQRQKAVDTLTAAMQAELTKIDTELNSTISGIKTSYDNKATADAVSMYNNEVEQNAKIREAEIKASTETAKLQAGNFNDLYNTIKTEYADLNKNFDNMLSENYGKKVTSPVHLDMIYEYQKQSGLPTNSTQMKMLLNAAGISAEDYEAEANNLYYLENGDNVKEIVPTMTSKAKQVLNTINGIKKTNVIGDKNIAPITNILSLIGQGTRRGIDKTAWLKETVNVIENSGLSETEKLAVMLELGIVDDVAALEEE